MLTRLAVFPWLAAVRRCTAACPFGGQGPSSLPDGHPDVAERRLSQSYPGYLNDSGADDVGALSYEWPGHPVPTYNSHLRTILDRSREAGDAELCYWAFHTYPAPSMREGALSVPVDEVMLWFPDEAENLGDAAARRMHGLVDQGGLVVWAGCAVGRTLRRAMCDQGLTLGSAHGARLEDCGRDAVRNQTLLHPTASFIFKIQSSRQEELESLLSRWRTDVANSRATHTPHMYSELYQAKRWGRPGQIVSKTVPCSSIPAKFRYQNLGVCDQLGDARLLADEAFEAWGGLCSVTKPGCAAASGAGSRRPRGLGLLLAAAAAAAAALLA